MRRMILAGMLAAMSATMPYIPALAQQADAEQADHYSVETTTIGTLLDDPAAAAIRERVVPTVYANDMFQTMGRPNTLRTAAHYEADLTEEKMKELQAEFDKIPAAPAAAE